jgi:23S rRNA (pseudouridine1915-N3)-methyltransferase
MKIACWFTGKTQEGFVREGLELYQKRLRRFWTLDLLELRDAGSGPDAPAAEAAQVMKLLQPGDILLLLDEQGEGMSSRQFASWLEKRQMQGGSRLIFLAGGAYGFDPVLRQRANGYLSLSPMTFNHQLVRLIFMEQLYRAATILHNHPYHHD